MPSEGDQTVTVRRSTYQVVSLDTAGVTQCVHKGLEGILAQVGWHLGQPQAAQSYTQ